MTTSKRILLIDDEDDHLLLCKLILERKGYVVMTISQSSKVMETVQDFNPDLIFTDHYMPGDLGTDITKMLKSNPTTKHIPVIYFSSCNDIVELAAEAGADAYLEKPFAFDKLIEITAKYL